MTKVMIIDDAPALRNSFSRMLREEGVEPIAMQDGLAALNSAGSHPPDVIVLDLNMPHMDGLEVLRRLRANMLWKSVLVIVFSGAPRIGSPAMRPEKLGVAAVLEKAGPRSNNWSNESAAWPAACWRERGFERPKRPAGLDEPEA